MCFDNARVGSLSVYSLFYFLIELAWEVGIQQVYETK